MVGARGAAVSCLSCVLPVAGWMVKGLEFGGKMGTHDNMSIGKLRLKNEKNLQVVCCLKKGLLVSRPAFHRK